MSRRSHASNIEAPGQDSFLDVVANLVGIFLILIIIVGSQAKSAVIAARTLSGAKTQAEPAAQPDAELREKLKKAENDSREVLREMDALGQKLRDNQFELVYRRKELEHSTIQLKLTEEQLKTEQAKLTNSEKDSVEAQVRLKELQDKRDELQADIDRLSTSKANVEVVENIPSPKAKKANVEEIQFRLKAGRILYVPLDDIVKDVMKDLERAAHEVDQRQEIVRHAGPIRGFRVRYRVYLEGKDVVAVNGTRGVMMRREADLQVEPVDEQGGELAEEALSPQSEMSRRLLEHSAKSATITLWVYPDSFPEFRKLRDALYKQGYLVAARPLPMDAPIGASTKGERSIGQ
jgi:hypothetical protein